MKRLLLLALVFGFISTANDADAQIRDVIKKKQEQRKTEKDREIVEIIKDKRQQDRGDDRDVKSKRDHRDWDDDRRIRRNKRVYGDCQCDKHPGNHPSHNGKGKKKGHYKCKKDKRWDDDRRRDDRRAERRRDHRNDNRDIFDIIKERKETSEERDRRAESPKDDDGRTIRDIIKEKRKQSR